MKRVLIVGEAPGAGRRDGLTRKRVSELAGRPWEEWADWRNLLDDWPGPRPRGKGSLWNPAAARRAALALDLARYERVVLLGRRVAGAVIPGGAGFPFFRWTDLAATRVAAIPHTSGIVRFWNEPANVERAAAFLRPLARPGGGPALLTVARSPGGEPLCAACRAPATPRLGRRLDSPARFFWWECAPCRAATAALPIPADGLPAASAAR